jgi:hypothetical protein
VVPRGGLSAGIDVARALKGEKRTKTDGTESTMKKLLLCLGAVLLGGCAGPHGLARYSDLHTSEHLRDERRLPMDFPKIQMALFKHKQACGSSPVFAMDPDELSYATITLKTRPGAGWEHTIVVDLTLLKTLNVVAKTYSYYAGVDKQIDEIFNAITNPTVCAKS